MAEQREAKESGYALITIISLPTNPLPDGYAEEEEGLAQSRQGAKEEGDELKERTLCASAPLRDILLCPRGMTFRQAVRHARRAARDYFGRSELRACRVRPVLPESRRSVRLGGPGPHKPRPNKSCVETAHQLLNFPSTHLNRAVPSH